MEVPSNYIRVRVDLSEVGVPFIKLAWVCVDRVILRTVKDFKQSLYEKFKLQEDRDISLYLQRCLLLEDESIFILRDEDVIRVVYDDFQLSRSTWQCTDVETFTSNSVKDFKRPHSVMKSITSLPSAKKFRSHSPILTVQSAQKFVDLDMPPDDSSYSDVRNIADIHTSNIACMRKKHKKHKNGLKERKEKIESKNFVALEERINDYGTNTHQNNMNNSDMLQPVILPVENTQKQVPEGGSYCEAGNSKRNEVKELSMFHLVKSINDNYLSKAETHCAEIRTNEVGSESIQKGISCSRVCELASSKKFKTSEEELPVNTTVELEVQAWDTSKALEDNSSTREQNEISQCDYDSMDLQNNQAEISYFATPTEISGANVKHSSPKKIVENVLFSPLNNSHLQVAGDCTQSLGNNCPKKKRRRRRRNAPESSAKASESNNASSSLTPPSSFQNSVSEFNQVTNNHNRKHIRFLNSPENSPTGEALSEKYSVDSVENERLADIDGSCTTQESSKMNVLSEHEAGSSSFKEDVIQVSFHQKEISPPSKSEDTSNSNSNVMLSKSEEVTDAQKSYANFPPLTYFPSVGDVIAYKILELGASYCPEVSDYKEGRIVNINQTTDELEIDLLEEQVIVREGKFENIYPNEAPIPTRINKVCVPWPSLIEPKLISSGTTL